MTYSFGRRLLRSTSIVPLSPSKETDPSTGGPTSAKRDPLCSTASPATYAP
jgi:hypothetical protein